MKPHPIRLEIFDYHHLWKRSIDMFHFLHSDIFCFPMMSLVISRVSCFFRLDENRFICLFFFPAFFLLIC